MIPEKKISKNRKPRPKAGSLARPFPLLKLIGKNFEVHYHGMVIRKFLMFRIHYRTKTSYFTGPRGNMVFPYISFKTCAIAA